MQRISVYRWFVFLAAFGEAVVGSEWGLAGQGCPREALNRCVKMAEPLMHNIDFVFPSRTQDVATVCRTWNDFINCVRSYTASCLVVNDQRQRQLENALAEAVITVDEMCTNLRYQADYLRHAPCIKSLAVDDAKCKKQYDNLVTQVSAFSISNVQICCAHHAFRECMLAATDRYCRLQSQGNAVQFARDMFAKALGFLLKQCHNHVPNSADCPLNGGQNRALNDDLSWRQSNTSPLYNDLVTRQSYQWPQTTRKPWFGSSNAVDSPKQQGLFSSSRNDAAKCSTVSITSLIILSYYLVF